MIDALVDNAKYLWGPCTERTMNIEVDPEQMNKTCWISQTNEQYACSVFVCSLPTLKSCLLLCEYGLYECL